VRATAQPNLVTQLHIAGCTNRLGVPCISWLLTRSYTADISTLLKRLRARSLRLELAAQILWLIDAILCAD
jgi:hypothetical protein